MSLMHLQVIDESGNHSVPEGAESHFKVVAVAPEFGELKRIDRHRRRGLRRGGGGRSADLARQTRARLVEGALAAALCWQTQRCVGMFECYVQRIYAREAC